MEGAGRRVVVGRAVVTVTGALAALGAGRRVVVGRAVVTVTGALAVLGAGWTVVVVVGSGAGVIVVPGAIEVVGSSPRAEPTGGGADVDSAADGWP